MTTLPQSLTLLAQQDETPGPSRQRQDAATLPWSVREVGVDAQMNINHPLSSNVLIRGETCGTLCLVRNTPRDKRLDFDARHA